MFLSSTFSMVECVNLMKEAMPRRSVLSRSEVSDEGAWIWETLSKSGL